MNRTVCKFTVLAIMISTIWQATPAMASPTVTNEQVNETQSQINAFESQVQQLDDQIVVAMEKSEKLQGEIVAQQEKISTTEADIEKAKEELVAHQEVLSERLKSIQISEQRSLLTYAEVLVSSNSFSEFLNRFTAITQIINSDSDLVKGLEEKKQALEDAEAALHNEMDQLKKNQENLALEQAKIEEDKKKVEVALAEQQTKLQDQQDQLAAQQLAEAQSVVQVAAQPAAVIAPANAVTPAADIAEVVAITELPAADASQIISIAKQYLGVPYVWGGTTPSGFDCSGFVSYVYRAVGISLPRTSRGQQNVGVSISPSQVQPGDLVFNGSPAYHVGIYIGGGQYIHAPQTGDVVKIAPYNPSNFSSAARVLR